MLEFKVGLRGEYRMRAINTSGDAVRDSGWMPNLITDMGMDFLGSGEIVLGFCSVGENNTAPAFSDTALGTYHQATSTVFNHFVNNAGAPDYQNQHHKIWRFPVQSVNKNYAEVGVGTGSTGNNLFSRALIVDGGGAPTTFTVLAGEQLEVTYRIWVYPKVVDSTNAVVISGTNYTFTYRGRSVNSVGNQTANNFGFGWNTAYGYLTAFNGTISANTGGGPSGSASGSDGRSIAAYGPGTFYRDVTSTFSTIAGNLAGGISAFESYFMTAGGSFILPIQIGVSPSMAKDATKVLSMTVRYSWARI